MDGFDPEIERLFDKSRGGERLTDEERAALDRLLATPGGKEQWADLERIRHAAKTSAAPLPADFVDKTLSRLGLREGIDTPAQVVRPAADFWKKSTLWAPIALAAGLAAGFFGRPIVEPPAILLGGPHGVVHCQAVRALEGDKTVALMDVEADFAREITLTPEGDRPVPEAWEAPVNGKLCRARDPSGACSRDETATFRVVYDCERAP